MPRDPLIHLKRTLRPGERLPREYEQEAEAWADSQRLQAADDARETDYHRNEEYRYERRDASQAAYEDRQLAYHKARVKELPRKG